MAVRRKAMGAEPAAETAAPVAPRQDALRLVVRTLPHLPRRWRAGFCFSPEARVVEVSAVQAEALHADTFLIIEPMP